MRGGRYKGQTVAGIGMAKMGHARPLALLFVWCLLGLSTCTGAVSGYTNRSLGNPIGSATTPPSSYESGLVNTPSPVDISSNQLVTGNVRGGKHFRGSIPYRSTTSFSGQLGSTSLDSFLRYSAVPPELGPSSRGYYAFYSPTGTVTTMRPGQRRVFAPTSPRVAGGIGRYRAEQPAEIVDLTEIPPYRVSTDEGRLALETNWSTPQRLRTWPLSRTPQDMQHVIADELGNQFTDRRVPPYGDDAVTRQDYQPHMRQLEHVRADAPKLEQVRELEDDLSQDEPGQPPRDGGDALGSGPPPTTATTAHRQSQIRGSSSERAPRPAVPWLRPERSMMSVAEGTETATGRRLELYRPPRGPDGLPAEASTQISRIDQVFAPRVEGGTENRDGGDSSELPALRRARETASAFDRPSAFLDRLSESRGMSLTSPLQDPLRSDGWVRREPGRGDVGSGRDSALLKRLRGTPGRQNGALAATEGNHDEETPDSSEKLSGERILEKYDYSKSFSRDRFDRYMRAGQLYMGQGRYYRAADSFTLASVYRPRDPQPYVGKSHALWAAGEYVSSALFLAQAIELDPRVALRQVDLVEVAGGPERFISRFNDLQECSQANDVPLLQFLLAYVYYQMGQFPQAKVAIEAAQEDLPSSVAIDMLRAAIGQ